MTRITFQIAATIASDLLAYLGDSWGYSPSEEVYRKLELLSTSIALGIRDYTEDDVNNLEIPSGDMDDFGQETSGRPFGLDEGNNS